MTNIVDRIVQRKAEGEWSLTWRPHHTETATTKVTATHDSSMRADTADRPNRIKVETKVSSTIGNERTYEMTFDREGAVGLMGALGQALDWDGRTQLEIQLQRKDDVIDELRKQVDFLDRQLQQVRKDRETGLQERDAAAEEDETPMTTLNVPDSPKMLRETLSIAQTLIGNWSHPDERSVRIETLQHLIDECDRHRPLSPDGKHGERHTPTCGCNVAADLVEIKHTLRQIINVKGE